MDKPMDNECSNLAIRIVACDDHTADYDGRIHTRGPKWRIKPNIQSLAELFHSWPGTEYKIFSRKLNVYELRKKFLVHLLKYHENEAEENISNIARQYLMSIKE